MCKPKSLTRDYPKQLQLVVRVGLELEISRFQVWCPNHLVTLPQPTNSQIAITILKMLNMSGAKSGFVLLPLLNQTCININI